ncbi:telomere-capping, CST complex subunit-domain-containing protein [Globomyces pollinis-pini]|nr:telomere-capping, CST complex subunit-domain-containing protein [Globomyces pollinis-pini]
MTLDKHHSILFISNIDSKMIASNIRVIGTLIALDLKNNRATISYLNNHLKIDFSLCLSVFNFQLGDLLQCLGTLIQDQNQELILELRIVNQVNHLDIRLYNSLVSLKNKVTL